MDVENEGKIQIWKTNFIVKMYTIFWKYNNNKTNIFYSIPILDFKIPAQSQQFK